MGVIESIVAALKAIPAIKDLIMELVGAINALTDSYRKAQEDKWLNYSNELAKRLSEAKSDEERAKLVGEISDLWRNIPGPR